MSHPPRILIAPLLALAAAAPASAGTGSDAAELAHESQVAVERADRGCSLFPVDGPAFVDGEVEPRLRGLLAPLRREQTEAERSGTEDADALRYGVGNLRSSARLLRPAGGRRILLTVTRTSQPVLPERCLRKRRAALERLGADARPDVLRAARHRVARDERFQRRLRRPDPPQGVSLTIGNRSFVGVRATTLRRRGAFLTARRRLTGIVPDGVARLGVRFGSGASRSVAVRDNAVSIAVPRGAYPARVTWRDADGDVIRRVRV